MKAPLQTLAVGFLATCALAAPAFAARHMASWSGEVDDTVIVRIHGDHVRTSAAHGAYAKNVTYRVDDPLPMAPVHVWLTDITGRGSVEVLREPTADNNYTAVIRLKDPQSGRGYYSFNLNWRTGFNHVVDPDNANDNDN